ncbi:hypothetical protein GALMADRAFT_239072 [Galerina marginata CBS 339.88]|uniref:F-box domain-containing protein n=1 Tax=Galerina marginata (strain CBS 339.88) TaxID=685588 RepID=A0A067TW38_GALM3|nr:hypothetical protein GALMADRAFT_239072 [Galerina marginata CBS 339.88]
MCQSFGSLVNLELDTVPFTISPSDVAENTFNFSRLNSLTLVKMAPEILQEIFRICVFEDTEEMDRLVFVQCPRLNQVAFPLLLTPELYLVGLDAEVDFEPILQDWGGEILSISCCSNFSDAFLQRLATRQYHQSEHVVGEAFQFLCHEMTTLDLHFPDSTPFSVDALRNMVEARNYEVDYTDANWTESMGLGPAITDVRAFGKVPELSQEDEEWFRSRLIHFFSWGEAIVDTLWFVLSFAIRASN